MVELGSGWNLVLGVNTQLRVSTSKTSTFSCILGAPLDAHHTCVSLAPAPLPHTQLILASGLRIFDFFPIFLGMSLCVVVCVHVCVSTQEEAHVLRPEANTGSLLV